MNFFRCAGSVGLASAELAVVTVGETPWPHAAAGVGSSPTYSSWLNQVERLFAEVTSEAIRRGSFQRVKSLERAIAEYLDARVAKPFVWVATADEILEKLRRFCLRTSRSGH